MVGTAVLVMAGMAVASAQNAPAGLGQSRDSAARGARSLDHRTPDHRTGDRRAPRVLGYGLPDSAEGRARRRSEAGPAPAAPQDLARARSARRKSDQRMLLERADDRDILDRDSRPHDLRKARGQVRSQARGSAAPSPQPHRTAAGGEQADIRKIQAALNEQGFDAGDPDGKLGRRTRDAVTAFQKQHGIHATGKVDRATRDALLSAAPGGGQSEHPAGTPPDNARSGGNADQPSPAAAPPQGTAPETTAAPPQGGEAGTTSGAAPQPTPLQPLGGETPPVRPPDTPQMPETGPSGRVPAGSPQDDFKDDTVPPGTIEQRERGGDQR
jgi:hypothetical protein